MSASHRLLPGKVWRPVALPLNFHLALDKGDWLAAFTVYKSQQYRAPPLDTYDLLKTILYKTGVRLDGIRHRFEQKVKLNLLAAKRAPETVEWHIFWEGLNNGDSRAISMGLGGARITGVQQQIAVAEACAVLLQSQGQKWHEIIVDEAPYSTVTSNNLMTICASLGRWDLALEVMPHVRVGKGEAQQLWQAYFSNHSWQVGLAFLSTAPPKALPHGEMIPKLLKSGCGLQLLAERLEARKMLTETAALTPLVDAAMDQGEWEFTRRCVDHLADVGLISNKAHSLLAHLCTKLGESAVFNTLRSNGVALSSVTVEVIEELRFGVGPQPIRTTGDGRKPSAREDHHR